MKTLIALILTAFTLISFAAEDNGFTTIDVSNLTAKHLGRECIVYTDIMGIAGSGKIPSGMITTTNTGNIYKGRLDKINGDYLEVSAAYPSQPQSRGAATIEKKHIKKIEIQKEAQSSIPVSNSSSH